MNIIIAAFNWNNNKNISLSLDVIAYYHGITLCFIDVILCDN